jgi:hypothetical protein
MQAPVKQANRALNSPNWCGTRKSLTAWSVRKRRFKSIRLASAGSSDAMRGLSMEIKVFMLASLFSMIAALYHLSNRRAKTDDFE